MQRQQLLKEAECDVKNYAERGGFYTPRSMILHIIRKPNQLIILLFLQDISEFLVKLVFS